LPGLELVVDDIDAARAELAGKVPGPFTWTKTADQIIDRVCRYCSRISEPAH
jgi:hypothetical protein